MTDAAPSLALVLHGISAVLWVGGMFFAHQCLRPALGDMQPPDRLRLWSRVFPKFFAWVWATVAVLPLTGYFVIFDVFGGFSSSPIHIHLMHGVGWLMIIIYLYLQFRPYAAFKRAVAAEAWPDAKTALDSIRQIVGFNLILGLITVALGASGRFWAWIPG